MNVVRVGQLECLRPVCSASVYQPAALPACPPQPLTHLHSLSHLSPANSGRAAAGALRAAARRGCRPLPAAHREQQPGAVRLHPPAGTDVGEPRALPEGPERARVHGEHTRLGWWDTAPGVE